MRELSPRLLLLRRQWMWMGGLAPVAPARVAVQERRAAALGMRAASRPMTVSD